MLPFSTTAKEVVVSQYRHVSQEKRYMLSQLLQAGMSKRKVADVLEVSHSTIIREVQRNSSQFGYRYRHAQSQYQLRRAKSCRSPVMTQKLCEQIVVKLDEDWSPEQISGRFRKENISTVTVAHLFIFCNFFLSLRRAQRLILGKGKLQSSQGITYKKACSKADQKHISKTAKYAL